MYISRIEPNQLQVHYGSQVVDRASGSGTGLPLGMFIKSVQVHVMASAYSWRGAEIYGFQGINICGAREPGKIALLNSHVEDRVLSFTRHSKTLLTPELGRGFAHRKGGVMGTEWTKGTQSTISFPTIPNGGNTIVCSKNTGPP